MFVCGQCGRRYEAPGYCAADGAPLAAAVDPLIGSEVGRYRVEKVIGEGGMGRVYLAVHPTIGSRVAVKVLSDACLTRPELVERFFAEARAVNLIKHENIVSVIDMAKLPDGRPYIVMEFIEGKTLAEVIHGVLAPLGGIVQIMSEVLSALGAAHQIGIVHRDLKPDNILVTAEGHAKVLDFGIAKLGPGLANNSPRTATGALMGTPAYMAPEQISGADKVDPRTDLYAAGVVLYEAATGRQPFQAEQLFDLMRMHVELTPQPPRALRADLPASFEGVILCALAKDPAHRFQSAAAMVQAMQHAAAELAPQEWKPVSGRAASLSGPRPSLPRMAQSTSRSSPGPVPLASSDVPTAPNGRSPTPAPEPSRVAVQLVPPTPARSSRLPLVLGLAGLSALAIAIGMIIGTRSQPAPMRPPVAIPPGTPTTPSVTKVETYGQVTHTATPNDDTYDPKHFDAMAFLPRAKELAIKYYSDVGFTRMDVPSVRSNGLADLTLIDDSEVTYYFRSPVHSERPADAPPNLEVDIPCYVEVTVKTTNVDVAIRSESPIDSDCRWPIRPFPRCTPAQIWAKAIKEQLDPKTIAKVDFLSDGKWFFDNEYNGTGKVVTYDDVCP